MLSVTAEKNEPNIGGFNSVQLNIVLAFDIEHLLETGDVQASVSLMDNSPDSRHQGTPFLETHCKQGQVINWLTFPLNSRASRDGTYPPSGRINHISFVDGENNVTDPYKICSDFCAYGGPDGIRSPYTSVYNYWAGAILSSLRPGQYRYRVVLETFTVGSLIPQYWNLEYPALRVFTMDSQERLSQGK